MHRRDFVRIGAMGALTLPQLRELLAQRPGGARIPASLSPLHRAPGLLERALTSKVVGFPTLQPLFGGIFLPGGNQTQLVTASSWDAFNTQLQSLATSGYRLASLTAIRNNNATSYYGAFEQGTGAFQVLHTNDPNQFQQAFTQSQSGYRLVDFAITWEQGQLAYAGYWLATSTPANQTLVFNVTRAALGSRWSALTAQGMRLMRVQAFPQSDDASFAAIFQPASGGYALWTTALEQFPDDLANRWGAFTLADLTYDMVNGNITAAFLGNNSSAQFVWNQDWTTLSAKAQQFATQGLILRSVTAYPNAPDFDSFFATNLAPYVMGYAYAVGKDGQVVASGSGYARGPNETANAKTAMTPDTRINLASVSKAVTGIALQIFLQKYNISIDAPFWPLIASKVPNPDASIKPVTIRNLVTMYSGMPTPPNEGPLGPPAGGDIWSYLNTYLAQPLTGTPGVTYSYNNENFTCLQGMIDLVSGQDYVTFVTQNVLIPAGMDTSIFNATSNPAATATLGYSGADDTKKGNYFGSFGFVAPGGWISSARELVKLPMALRNTSVLSANTTSQMFIELAGWYEAQGNFGTYYHHNGGLGNGATPAQQINTVIVHLAEGYDIALVANSHAPSDVTALAIDAFDSRALVTNDFAITAVFHAASYLPKLSPGAYGSVTGTGFFSNIANTDWGNYIEGGALPQDIEGIRVNVDGQPVVVEYINPGQVNFLLPMNQRVGTSNLELFTPSGTSLSAAIEIDAVAPGLFTYSLNGLLYPAAVYATADGSVVYVAPTGALAGYNSRAAAAGDLVELYATGCGQTTPVAPDGVVLTQVYPAANPSAFNVTIAGKSAAVQFAGLVGPGLFQINIQIPAGLPGGDQPLVLSVNNIASQPNVKIAIKA